MRDLVFVLILLSFSSFAAAQAKPRPTPLKIPAGVPIKPGTTTKQIGTKTTVDLGKVAGRTYTNETFNFEVTFPDTWLIPDADFESYMKKQGFDLSLKAPDSLSPASQSKIDKAVKRINILLTAYRSMPGATDNTIVRISVENLSDNPQIKDAVDYFDAIVATYATIQLPYDFKYSDTKAEKLGDKQFGYLDTSTTVGKKRMYATVRNGFAIMFTISYTKDEDLQTLRRVIEEGNFKIS